MDESTNYLAALSAAWDKLFQRLFAREEELRQLELSQGGNWRRQKRLAKLRDEIASLKARLDRIENQMEKGSPGRIRESKRAESGGRDQGMATHTLRINGWHPHRLNELLTGHWAARYRRKQEDHAIVALEALAQQIPQAEGKRRIGIELILGPRQRGGDPDAYWKSCLDALVGCGLLCDDSRRYVELGPVTFARGPRRATVITLEDLEDQV